MGAVNVTRFSSALVSREGSSLLASGADDNLVCIYELHKGTGNKALGSTDAPNIENWKLSQVGEWLPLKHVMGTLAFTSA
jgi:hypothetical protein